MVFEIEKFERRGEHGSGEPAPTIDSANVFHLVGIGKVRATERSEIACAVAQPERAAPEGAGNSM